MDKANEHGLRLCMVQYIADGPWECGWFSEYIFLHTSRCEQAVVFPFSSTDGKSRLANDIRFPDTPALPKHAPPEAE